MSKVSFKLFVWDGVLTDYTDGIIVAYARNIEEARKIVLIADDLSSVQEAIANEPKVYDAEPIARVVWGGG